MANQIRNLVLLFLIALSLFLIGNNLHSLWDRDEPRYAVATREMVQTGDYVLPHFNGDIRYDKPVLTYWLMAVPWRVFGENEFAVRFPAALMGAFRALLVALLAMRMGAGRGGGFVAGLMAALLPLLVVISKASTTDSTLVTLVLAALLLYWDQEKRGFAWWRHIAFWAVMALAALDKGPPGLLVVLLAIGGYRAVVAWNNREKGFRFSRHFLMRAVTGIAIFLIVGLPWAIAVWRRTNGEFLEIAINRHVIHRSETAMEGHSGPLLYYIPVILLTTFPFCALLFESMTWGFLQRRRREMIFLWSWVALPLVVFSLVRTKLPHYAAPMIPPFCIMAGLWWTERVENRTQSSRAESVAGKIGAGLAAFIGVAAVVALPIAMRIQAIPLSIIPGVIVTVILGAATVIGAILWFRGRIRASVAAVGTGWMGALVMALVLALPMADQIRPSHPVGDWLKAETPAGTTFLMLDYDEPSLVFYGGRQFTSIGKSERERGFSLLNDVAEPVALVTTRSRWDKFRHEWEGHVDPRVTVRYEKKFFYFEKGEPVTIVVIGNW